MEWRQLKRPYGPQDNPVLEEAELPDGSRLEVQRLGCVGHISADGAVLSVWFHDSLEQAKRHMVEGDLMAHSICWRCMEEAMDRH